MRYLFSVLSLSLCLLFLSFVSSTQSLHYSPTPSGPIRSDCIHTVPSGSLLSRDQQGTLWANYQKEGVHFKRIIPKCDKKKGKIFISKKEYYHRKTHRGGLIGDLPSDYDGWTSYTAYNSSQSFDSFLGYFSVPDNPANYPDILYVFTGLQNIDWIPLADPESAGQGFDIIQPVLQYPADSGTGWSVKSWFVTLDEGAVNSDEVACQTGDRVFGNMTRINGDNWYIGSTCSGGTTEITHSDVRLSSQPWAYNTLELYGGSGCSTYPTIPITFSKLLITQEGQTIKPQWKVDPKPSKLKQCNEKSTVVSPSNVIISFQ